MRVKRCAVKAILLSIAKKITWVFAILIILMAILVCASRLLAPVLDKHKPEIESYASAFLKTPVTIGKVSASWYQYHPVISLDNVTILHKEDKKPVLQIENVRVFFSLLQSLWQRKLILSGVMISGADLNVRETKTGEFSVQGFPTLGGFQNSPYQEETKSIDMVGWVSLQPRIILRDIDLKISRAGGEVYEITLYQLNVENTASEHHISGKAILHQEIPTKVSLALTWEGKTFDPNKIRAKAYLYVSGMSLPQWLKKEAHAGWEIKKGIASAKVWVTWSRGQLKKVQTTFQTFGLELFSVQNSSLHKINRFSGNIGWKRQGQGQVIAGDDILIDLPTHLWPVTSFYVSLLPDANLNLAPKTATLGYVDFKDVQTFLAASPPISSKDIKVWLSRLGISGALQNATMTFGMPWQDFTKLTGNAKFSQIKTNAWEQLPGLKNITGSIKWNGHDGELTLNTHRAAVQYPSLFQKPIAIDQITGTLAVKYNEEAKNWTLSTTTLQLFNSDAAANIQGAFTLPQEGAPVFDLSANFTVPHASHITRYLPLSTFDKDLEGWLKQAFLAGEITSGQAILKGSLADFPFDNNNGTFSIIGKVNHVDLSYAPDWPHLRNINGQVAFMGRKMEIEVNQAEIMGIPITNVKAAIPYLGDKEPQILNVESDDIAMDFAQGLKFVHASPLEKNIGSMFADMVVSGSTQLKLNLTVPLAEPEKTAVKGDLLLDNALMNLSPWRLVINQLNGSVQFTEDSLSAKQIQGKIFNAPLTFSLETIKKSDTQSIIRAPFTTTLNVTDLESWLDLPVSRYAKGQGAVKGELSLAFNAPIELHLMSDLKGIALNLPDQFSKKADEVRNLALTIYAKEKEPLRLKMSYEQALHAALILNRKHNQFSLIGANILLGKGEAEWPATPGLYLTGHFAKLDWDQVKKYLGNAQAESFSNNEIAGLKLEAIDIHAEELAIAGLNLKQTHIEAAPQKEGWEVEINSPQIAGQLQVPLNFHQGMITAQFAKLNLPALISDDKKQQGLDFVIKDLPAMTFNANNVSYNDIPLGQVNFKTIPNGNGLIIRSLNINSPRMNLEATGDWSQSGKTYFTRLQGRAESNKVSSLLNSFGLDVHNFVASKGKLTFNLNWKGVPFAPSLSGLSGRASIDLGPGRIVDIGQENGAKMDLGRMLSIFSLQTIPRRLSFDFSDVFQKGYSFDSIRGDFSFQNGDANTTNLRFDGPVARVGINGRIGLRAKDYNFTLSVTPYVTSTLPVAATIFGGPIIGAAALAVNTVLGSQISKAVATYYYVVTGPWDNPSWKSVNSGKRQ